MNTSKNKMSKDLQYYNWGNENGYARITPKQLRILKKDGSVDHIGKPTVCYTNNNYKLHTYVFKNGDKREWFVASKLGGYKRSTTLKAVSKKLTEGIELNGCYPNTELCFVKHRDDKMFYKYRYAVQKTTVKEWFKANGKLVEKTTWKSVLKSVKDLRGKEMSSWRTNHSNGGWTTNTVELKSIVICEKWVKWGGFDILVDNGIEEKSWYYYDDKATNTLPKKDMHLPITEFRNSGPHNPFDDPFEPHLKKMRDDRNWFKEQIAMEVFKPERVERMVEKYGIEWLEKV